jgi:oligopeptide transport system substrate-binding protein
MRVPTRTTRALAVATAGIFALSACGGGSSDDGAGEGTGGDTPTTSDGTWSMYIGEPENPLVPGNTSETEGGQIVDALWTGLVQYADDNSVEYTGVAESIESEDNTTWTVTLKPDWTFHDGTPVTANSFVDAWNYTALSTNAQGGSYFFANIEGYDALQAETDADGNVVAEPTATEMTGLSVVDDLTFTVTLNEAFSIFPVTVGYTAFYPLPESFFDDPEAFGTAPVGNGPFQADGEFQSGVGITTTRYDDYAGEEPAKSGGVEFRIYTDVNTAYADVQGGNLDVVDSIPPDAIASAEAEFGDRYGEAESSSFTYLGFPTYDERFSDPVVRQAFSQAIDRQAITDAIFEGTRVPADSYVAPTVDGYREGACEYCVLDVEAANEKLDAAGFDRSQPVELWFNSGAGHDAWVQAVGNQLRENLGVDYTLRGDFDFSQYLPLADEQGFTGPFRLGWVMDYPSAQNYLEPLYSEASLPPNGSNTTFYTNPEFDAKIAEGNQAASPDEAVTSYNEAEDILLQDMPIIPMFYGLSQYVWSDRVSDVSVDVFTRVEAADVVVSE